MNYEHYENNYEKAVAEIVFFDNSDVITTSGNTYCIDTSDRNWNGCRDGVTQR